MLTDLLRAQPQSASPCQRRFINFLIHCVWTKDESAGGIVRRFPTGYGRDGRHWLPMWLEMEDIYLREPKFMLEKSRRVLASWFTCAFDVWVAAGGQDPRWRDESGRRTLMLHPGNRQVAVVAQKMRGLGGTAWFLRDRIGFILEEFEKNDCRRYWPEFPTWSSKEGEIAFSNGSRICAVAQGEHQVRGAGSTVLHVEEVAFMDRAEKTVGPALQTLRGGGHAILITTANSGSYAHRLRDGRLGFNA